MEEAKRARKAETPKQPSLYLTLRAPYLYPDHLRHARLTTLQRKKSQSVLLQSVARRLYKDRSPTMGRQKRRPTIVARRPITLARSPAPAARGTDIGLPTGSGI